jgi:hypothetical protein
MNCPHCNSPSADGKRYCADCGTPLDPQTKRLETFVKSQVEEAIQQRFKDQKLVDIETSQAVAERLHGWAKIFAFAVGVPLGLLIVFLSVAGIEKYSDLKKLVATVEEQINPKIEQAKSDAEQAQKTAKEAKSEAEDSKKTIEGATAEAKRQLGSATELAKNVKGLSDRVSGLEQQASNQIKGSSQRVDSRMIELDQKIDAATKDIADQQKKLASTDQLVKTLFSKGTTELFSTAVNGSNVVIAPRPNGALVFMLLKSAPIYQTIEVKWHVFSQPRGSYGVSNNVLIFSWGDPADNLKQHALEVTYVPDPTSKDPAFKALSVKDNASLLMRRNSWIYQNRWDCGDFFV